MEEVALNLTSMIDVVFLLLIYFMVTMVIAPTEDELSSTIQTRDPETASASDFQPQIVEVLDVDGRPGFRLGERTFFEQAPLRETLGGLNLEAGVFVHVHGEVPVGAAASAMQAARDAGFERVTYVPVE